MFALGSILYFLAALLIMKLQNWCLAQPLIGASSLKLFLSEVTVSLNIIGGISFV